MRLNLIGIAAALLAGAPSLAGAQLSGTVIDASGLPIPHAVVTVAGTRASQSDQTDDRGNFAFAALPAGPCQIHIERTGFEPFDKPLAGEDRVLRVQLRIETRHDSIVVKAPSQDPAPGPPIGFVSIDAVELRRISNDPKVWVNYARMLAGSSNSPAQIYVDGMPAAQLPPAAQIARIIVNPDTFSAEYTDGGNAHIDIVTKAPDRRFHFNLGSDSAGAGGGSVLTPGPQAVLHSVNGSLSGAVPHLPLAFSVVGSFAESIDPVAVTAILPGAGFPSFDPARTGTYSTRAISLSPDLYYYPSETLRLHLSNTESRSGGRNLGVGGLTLMDAGVDHSFRSGETRFTFNGGEDRLSYRGGLVVERSNVESRARNTEAGLNVLGNFSTGGPQILNNDAAHFGATAKIVVEPSLPSWSAGITAVETGESRYDAVNPAGVFTFADLPSYAQFLKGSGTATWTGLRGNGSLHIRQFRISPFFQKLILQSAHVIVNAGVRADTQSSAGTAVSPRLSAAIEWRRFVIRAGAGMFSHDIPGYVFVHALQGDGNHLTPLLIGNAAMDAASQSAMVGGPLVRTSLSPSLSLPRQFIGKVSANRTLGPFTPAIEYTQTYDWKLLGSQRFADGNGWMDLIASNRARAARQLQSQLSYSWKGQRLTVFHEWVRSYDNTEGPFSFPQWQNNLAAEWARSAGRAGQNVTFAGSFKLIESTYLTMTDSWHGSAPYNITDSSDPEGNGLFNSRGGRPRNSGNGPSFNSLSGYLSHRFAAPKPFGRTVHGVTVGLRGDNLLGNKNYLSVGSVANSPSFGQPLAAAPGRSVRLWFSFD